MNYVSSKIFVSGPLFVLGVPLFIDVGVLSGLVVGERLLSDSYHLQSGHPGGRHGYSVKIPKVPIQIRYVLGPIYVVFDGVFLITKSREAWGIGDKNVLFQGQISWVKMSHGCPILFWFSGRWKMLALKFPTLSIMPRSWSGLRV